jgi:hypothetical protein
MTTFEAPTQKPSPADILNGRNPSILVFDCDWTLYPYDCDKDCIAPFQRRPHGIVDRWGRWADPYPDAPYILGAIVDAGIPVAFLSRNPSAGPLEQLLRTLPMVSSSKPGGCFWDAMRGPGYFHAYSNSGNAFTKGKDRHFAALRAATGVHPNHMLFFDDMPDNIQAAAAQGTTGILLGKPGLTWAAFTAGITGWREHLKKIEAAEAGAEAHGQNGAT